MTANGRTGGANAFDTALAWVEGTVLGPLAFSIAIIAVAGVGYMLLAGRLDIRRGAQVVLGCFVVFGASVIADGILSLTVGSASDVNVANALPPPSYPPLQAQPVSPAATIPYDPYAGAAVPTR